MLSSPAVTTTETGPQERCHDPTDWRCGRPWPVPIVRPVADRQSSVLGSPLRVARFPTHRPSSPLGFGFGLRLKHIKHVRPAPRAISGVETAFTALPRAIPRARLCDLHPTFSHTGTPGCTAFDATFAMCLRASTRERACSREMATAFRSPLHIHPLCFHHWRPTDPYLQRRNEWNLDCRTCGRRIHNRPNSRVTIRALIPNVDEHRPLGP